MQITNDISFGSYHSVLKTLWKRGQLPTVKRGFYGDILTLSNVSLEHLSPHAHSKRSDLHNLVLASVSKNRHRDSTPLWKIIDMDTATDYLEQFRSVHIAGKFDGADYINMIKKRLLNMGIDLDKKIISKTPKVKSPKTKKHHFVFKSR